MISEVPELVFLCDSIFGSKGASEREREGEKEQLLRSPPPLFMSCLPGRVEYGGSLTSFFHACFLFKK